MSSEHQSFCVLRGISVGAVTSAATASVDGCWRKPGVGYLDFEDFGDVLDVGRYTTICRQCWPSGSPTANELSDTTSDASSSSSLSSE